jgi:hypothetical protein
MGEYKPLGSEKLNVDEKLKRILELAYYNNNTKSKKTNAELVEESVNGNVYGIVKEKDGYYVKSGLNESSLDYIGGMFMKNKNKFSSYAEAYKRLEFIKGQEELQLQESTKYVLKQKPQGGTQTEAPSPAPSMDTPPPPPPAPAPSSDMPPAPAAEPAPASPDASAAPTDSSATNDTSAVDGEGKPSSYMAEIQKFAGKLGQELRDQHQKLESDDIKYVLNMIISAVDLKKLDDEDIEEIAKRFEREEKERGLDGDSDMGSDDMSSGEPSSDEPAPAPAPTEMNENDPMASLDEFINSPVPNNEIDLSKYAIKEDGDFDSEDMQHDETKELDLDEIKNAIGETLSKYFN